MNLDRWQRGGKPVLTASRGLLAGGTTEQRQKNKTKQRAFHGFPFPSQKLLEYFVTRGGGEVKAQDYSEGQGRGFGVSTFASKRLLDNGEGWRAGEISKSIQERVGDRVLSRHFHVPSVARPSSSCCIFRSHFQQHLGGLQKTSSLVCSVGQGVQPGRAFPQAPANLAADDLEFDTGDGT